MARLRPQNLIREVGTDHCGQSVAAPVRRGHVGRRLLGVAAHALPGDAFVGVLLGDLGVKLSAYAGNLGYPVGVGTPWRTNHRERITAQPTFTPLRPRRDRNHDVLDLAEG